MGGGARQIERLTGARGAWAAYTERLRRISPARAVSRLADGEDIARANSILPLLTTANSAQRSADATTALTPSASDGPRRSRNLTAPAVPTPRGANPAKVRPAALHKP